MPVTDIFIKTCDHDREYLKRALKSIDKYCTGFRQIKIVEGEHPRGWLFQQAVKLSAHTYTDADYFLFTDSDTLFTMDVTPETYFVEGKPIWIHTPFSDEMLQNAGVRAWKECMVKFFGMEPPSEFMRRQPFMIPAWLLKEISKFCLERHRVDLVSYIMGQKAFSEYNVAGFFAWLFHRDEFHWINSDVNELPELTVRQFWSHDPIEKNMEAINAILT